MEEFFITSKYSASLMLYSTAEINDTKNAQDVWGKDFPLPFLLLHSIRKEIPFSYIKLED